VIDCDQKWEPSIEIPKNRIEAYKIFGNPGSLGVIDKKWERENMIVARDLPGPIKKLYVHRLAEPFLRESLARAVSIGAEKYITRLGCFNFRSQRHDASRPLSYHAFGIAIDINPSENSGWYRDPEFSPRRKRGPIPAPFDRQWCEYWPSGIPENLVECFESVGWRWGGRWKTYVDPMHFQLVL
jgi:hypothetical protein